MSGSNSPLGLFGGRFDPVHHGHIAIAQAAADQLGLERILWIVAGDPVHKSVVADADDRLEMVRLALEELGDSRMVIDPREIEATKKGLSTYTADTVASIKMDFPKKPLVWLIGEDQLSTLSSWYRWKWLCKAVTFAICPRLLDTGQEATKIEVKTFASFRYLDTNPNDISSTRVRQLIRTQKDISSIVPEKVARYIRKRRLYM